jgi:hypothetical protein
LHSKFRSGKWAPLASVCEHTGGRGVMYSDCNRDLQAGELESFPHLAVRNKSLCRAIVIRIFKLGKLMCLLHYGDPARIELCRMVRNNF